MAKKANDDWKTIEVVAPSKGINTRIPTDQVEKVANRRNIVTASNVRCAQGVLSNAPGYESCDTSLALDSAPNMIFQANLNPNSSSVVDDTVYIGTAGNLYAGVKQFSLPPVVTVVPPEDLNTCGAQLNWTGSPSGIPYTNTGNTVTGLTNIAGYSITSDGTKLVLTTGASPPFYSFTALPVQANDFIAQMTCQTTATSGLFGFTYSDLINQRTLVFATRPPYFSVLQCVDYYCCDPSSSPTLVATAISNTPITAIPANTPFTVKVIKTGSVFLTYVNNVQYLSYDAGSSNVTGIVGLYFDPGISTTAFASNITIN